MSIFGVLRWTIMLAVLGFLAMMLFISLYGLREDAAPSDVGIILGSRIEDNGTPSPGLAARLDRGAALFRQGFVKHIITTGERERNGYTEGEVMRNYLSARGVPSDAIIAEDYAKNTWENARDSIVIMHKRGWHSAIIVSEFFHIHRARWFFREQGLTEVHTASAMRWNSRLLPQLFRETCANIYYILIGR